MASSSGSAQRTIDRLMSMGTISDIVDRLKAVDPSIIPLPPEVPHARTWSAEAVAERRAFLAGRLGISLPYLSGELSADPIELRGNVEQMIGMTTIPTGIIGPLRINGVEAKGDFYVPLATTEGALVASYHRGARLVSQSGGATSICVNEGVQRSPGFLFQDFAQAGVFLVWAMKQLDECQRIVSERSRYAVLHEVRPNIEGNHLSLVMEYTTGDAAGQNMVTLCTDDICRWLVEHCPVKPTRWFVEGNLSGDKKATAIAFATVRGKKVTAEARLARNLVIRALGTTPEAMMEYWKTSLMNGVQSGSIGVNGHFANGLAAIFLACGQDVACVAEASVGTTRFDITEQGDLYASVSLPNLIVGTVGGGTRLSTQHECLSIMGCTGNATARRFAEICGATILCGELSIVGAIAAGEFTRAHELYGRRGSDGA